MARSSTSSQPELLVPLHRDDPIPLHRQLERELRESIRDGRLAAGAALPSTRSLASELGVARGVVVEAYEQLAAEGYVVSRPGADTRVTRVPLPTSIVPAAPPRPSFTVDLRPGRPDLGQFPRGAWLRSLRRVLDTAPAVSLGYLDGQGEPTLRTALSEYLNRARGTCIAADDIVIATGFAQALQLVAHSLRASGRKRVAVEDPWHHEYRAMIEAAGGTVVGIGVDDDGIRVDLVEAAHADLVIVTAAHQYPTGAVLSAERRSELVAWAAANDALILEDDYDAEFRYDRVPIGAIQGLCADRVVYAGTASKMLVPGLRLGWLAAPSRLVPAIASAKLAADHGSSALDQLAFADFIEAGELDRHLRRMRALYRRRRDALLAALERDLPDWRPVGASAGLHVLAWLPAGLDESLVVSTAAELGIGLTGVAPYHLAPAETGGIVFGYAAVDERRIESSIRELAARLVGAGRAR